MSPIRVGVAGFRNIGRGLAGQVVKCEGAELAAAADLSDERLADARGLNSECRCYTSVDEMIADESLDAIINALPNHLHAPVSIKAMEAGKDVLVEKPITQNVAAAREMVEARDRTGKTLVVGMNQRFSPQIYALRKAIADGIVGNVLYTKTAWNQQRPGAGLWQRGEWFLSTTQGGGGPLIDLGIHRLDLALHLIGFPEVESVFGTCTRGVGSATLQKMGKTYEIEDGASALIRFNGGSSLVLEASYFRNAPEEEQYTLIQGSRGYIVHGSGASKLFVAEGEDFEETELALPANVPNRVEHFIRVLQGEEEIGPTAEQGIMGLEIIEAVYKSAETGKLIEL